MISVDVVDVVELVVVVAWKNIFEIELVSVFIKKTDEYLQVVVVLVVDVDVVDAL